VAGQLISSLFATLRGRSVPNTGGILWVTLALELLYLLLVWRIHDNAHLGMSLLFIGATALMLMEHPPLPATPPHWSARLFGAAVIIGVAAANIYLLGQGLKSTEQHPLRLLPMAALLGPTLWSAGYSGVLRYRRELLVLFFLGGPHLLMWWLEIPERLALWDARAAGFFLWYGGEELVIRGDSIFLQGGGIKVTPECAGSDIITYLLGIALVATMLFPLPRRRYGLVLGMAVVIAFLVNVVRVALLAVLNTWPEKEAFHYWHTSEGAQLFGVTALVLFALFYRWLERSSRIAAAHRSGLVAER